MHKAMVDECDHFAVLVPQSRTDNHEDHRARAAGLFIDFLDTRRHSNSIAGADRRDEIDVHAGRQTARRLRKLFKSEFREAKNPGKRWRSDQAIVWTMRGAIWTGAAGGGLAQRQKKKPGPLGRKLHPGEGVGST